jgi:arylsulfatase A-like enzyme
LPVDALTLPRMLKPYGYDTANIGKLHFRNHATRDHREPHPDYGFDTLILSAEPGCYDDAYIKWVEAQNPAAVPQCRCTSPSAVTTGRVEKRPRNTHEPYAFEGPEHLTHSAFVADETIRFLRAHRERPFLLIAGFFAPHPPVNPPQRFVDLYDPAALEPPALREDQRERLGLSDEEWRRVKAFYYALVSHVDGQVGRIHSCLEECGLRERTLVIFTSDHGEYLGDHGRVQKGPPGYDCCVHVPLILSQPGRIPAGETRSELIEAVDLLPTILDGCAIQCPPQAQGRSFQGLLEGHEYQPRRSVYVEYKEPFGISWKTVRTARWKYCASNTGEERLFDLQKDPHELQDVSGDAAHATDLQEMRREWMRRIFEAENQYPRRTGRY